MRALILSLLLLPAPLVAQDTAHVAQDTAHVARDAAHVAADRRTPAAVSPKLFGARDAAYAGGFVAATVALTPFDRRIARWMQRPALQDNHFLSNTASVFRTTGDPGAIIIGTSMYVVGRIAHIDRAADLGLHGTEAIGFGGLLTSALKGLMGRARPDVVRDSSSTDFQFLRGFRKGNGYESFPSGHSLAAFAAASAVTAETSRWWPGSTWFIGPVMYGGASAVGLSRMYNDKHWASDVILGAGIGTFSGLKVVQYHHMHPHNRIDRLFLRASAAPVPGGGAVSFSF